MFKSLAPLDFFITLSQGKFTLNLLLKTPQPSPSFMHFSPIFSPGTHCPWLHRSLSCQEHQKQNVPQYLESKWGRSALATWPTKPDVLDAPWHLRFRGVMILDQHFVVGKNWDPKNPGLNSKLWDSHLLQTKRQVRSTKHEPWARSKCDVVERSWILFEQQPVDHAPHLAMKHL